MPNEGCASRSPWPEMTSNARMPSLAFQSTSSRWQPRRVRVDGWPRTRFISCAWTTRVDECGGAVPVQFVEEVPGASRGELLLLVEGRLGSADVAHFDLYFDTTDRSPTPVATSTLVAVESATDEGLDTLRITTPGATYHFDTAGGGFSSLVDADGNDWIGYSTAPRSSGEFRGIPNLIYPEGTFHPGATGVTTSVVEEGPLRTAFTAVTADGLWRRAGRSTRRTCVSKSSAPGMPTGSSTKGRQAAPSSLPTTSTSAAMARRCPPTPTCPPTSPEPSGRWSVTKRSDARSSCRTSGMTRSPTVTRPSRAR